ncbi:lysophospholipid acyltransferase family protein [uncultured Pelagimonas sp.]|uniref:lysophospholipid acyltransferase family protein n=1 Tax=uncultured Pelagimonas sp. TaxID=1618102 RepID=UPI00262A9826|nr:lysophospholipid acyltransferase family protein [uncultured Pelagimonas sp.]
MKHNRHIARDISYAYSAQSKPGRAVIRMLENATGRLSLIKRAQGYEEEVSAGRDFWQVMVERYGLELEVVGGRLDNIPKSGPVIAIANHPYGILDGLMMGHILSQARGDFRILAHRIFRRADELDKIILPVNFDESREAVQQNLKTRKECLAYLGQGGCVGIFPGGTVATAEKPFGTPMDPGWRTFTARMISKSDAAVVPIFFDGHTSRLFQVASHMHTNLRMGLLIKEFRKRVDTPVRVSIGKPIPRAKIDAYSRDARGLMDFLRKSTYDLSPKPVVSYDYGFEFEEKHKSRAQSRDKGRG